MQQKQRLVVKLSLAVGRKVSKKTLFVAVKSLEGGLHGRYETICAATVKCLFCFGSLGHMDRDCLDYQNNK